MGCGRYRQRGRFSQGLYIQWALYFRKAAKNGDFISITKPLQPATSKLLIALLSILNIPNIINIDLNLF